MSGGAPGLASVMQQSLHAGRKPERPSGHYPDKSAVVAAYKRMVQTVLESREERAQLHKALKEFHGTLLVEDLMENLKEILTDPRRRQLYLAIRPLIPSRMRGEYNTLIPHIPTFEKKIVHLKQQGNRSLGFNIRGGKEFKCGIYITSVLPSSKAAQAGIKVGDEIVRINGLILSESTHEEVVNIIRLKKTLTLTLRVVGMIPEQNVFGKLTWKVTEEKKSRGGGVGGAGGVGQPHPHSSRLNTAILKSTKKIRLDLENPDDVLGLGIKTIADRSSGVFIAEIRPNSVAHNSGLEIGDELIDVNGHGLVGVAHKDAIRLLKSSNTLMVTVRVKDPRAHLLSNPPDNFELTPHDFDIDSELIPSAPAHSSHGFVLKSKHEVSAEQQRRQKDYDTDNRFSLLGMEIPELDQLGHAPIIAAPAAVGYGPTVAMPTLIGMMPPIDDFQDDVDGEGGEDASSAPDAQVKLRVKSPGRDAAALNARESVAFTDMTQVAIGDQLNVNMPESFASLFQNQQSVGSRPGPGVPGTATGTGAGAGGLPDKPPSPISIPRAQISNVPPVKKKSPPLSTKPNSNKSSSASQNLSDSFQFPVVPDDDDSEGSNSNSNRSSGHRDETDHQSQATPTTPQQRHVPDLTRKPSASALKKSPSSSSEGGSGSGVGQLQGGGAAARKKKAPAFNDSVEIINVEDNRASGGSDNGKSKDYIHPSNMEFSEKVLQGRNVAFHTIPKNGPIKVAIRGGTDTPLGGAIIISRILEGGAAARYGRLNVGDQILVCDGVSLIDVTHDEAAQALKRAMDMEANSIDLVVAVNPDVEQPANEGPPQQHSPRTPWPLPEETVCDDHPQATQYDYSKSSRRAHSGFTLRGKDKEDATQNAHAFLPPPPK